MAEFQAGDRVRATSGRHEGKEATVRTVGEHFLSCETLISDEYIDIPVAEAELVLRFNLMETLRRAAELYDDIERAKRQHAERYGRKYDSR